MAKLISYKFFYYFGPMTPQESHMRLPPLNHLTKSITTYMYSCTLCTHSVALKMWADLL
jgi:hypothetical protein